MFGSCLVIAIVAALYEGLKVIRDSLLKKAWSVPCNGEAVAVPTTDIPTVETAKLPHRCVRQVFSYSRIMVSDICFIFQLAFGSLYKCISLCFCYAIWY